MAILPRRRYDQLFETERTNREPHVQPDIAEKREALAELCRRYGVARLEVFGSAARGVGFDRNRSDADFLVTFKPSARNDLAAFADLKDALEQLLGRPVDLVERETIEASRNFIRRRAILNEAETVYG
jgi:predicted nucleotidyltransferase